MCIRDSHDYHHMAFLGCYSTSFRWWDHFLGTDRGYQRVRAKQKAQKLRAEADQLDKYAASLKIQRE